MSIKYATEAELDLLTIGGSGGGTGMSPWNMMESWGVPSIHLHSKAHKYASILAARGDKVVDLAFAGGLAREDHIFKALALGAPYTKLICMGRSLMIPGYLGSNIEGVIHPERREKLNGNWDQLPPAVAEQPSFLPLWPLFSLPWLGRQRGHNHWKRHCDSGGADSIVLS